MVSLKGADLMQIAVYSIVFLIANFIVVFLQIPILSDYNLTNNLVNGFVFVFVHLLVGMFLYPYVKKLIGG